MNKEQLNLLVSLIDTLHNEVSAHYWDDGEKLMTDNRMEQILKTTHDLSYYCSILSKQINKLNERRN